MRVSAKVLSTLNKIYQEILQRPIDEDGINKYSKYLPFEENYIRKNLVLSDEYLILKGFKQPKSENISQTIKYSFIKGRSPEKNNTDLRTKKLLVLSLVNNCIKNKTFNTIREFINALSDKFHTVKVGILTNNNMDRTINKLIEWQNKNNNILINQHKNELVQIIDDNNNCGNKIFKLAEYREKILKESLDYFGTDFDYIIVFDSDIIFDTRSITNSIADSICIDEEWSAISANNCFSKSNIHYDTLALRLKDQPIDIQTIYPLFKEYYGKNYKWNSHLYIFNDFVEVQCGFGALTIYNAKEIIDLYKNNKIIYNIYNLPECTCEHIGLDLQLKHKHFINSQMKLPSNAPGNHSMYSKSVLFLPRDAGFFSVFNFLVGIMSNGVKAYPYFNKKLFLKYRGKNEHFCYWTDNENAWFDYFEPISYYENDNEHIDKKFVLYPISGGDESPEEFRMPKVFKNLLTKDQEQFQNWRNRIHNVYSQYIKFHPDIIKETNDIFSKLFNNSKYVIGLHYRHPSHSVESGPILLQQYYNQIDNILKDHPDAKIFLATDTEFGIVSFKYKYGDRIQYIENIDRLPIDNILQWAYAMSSHKNIDVVGMVDGKGYELHHQTILNNMANYYTFTKNLLIEVLCLSKCNILVNSTSNISLALSYINPSIPIITL